MVRISGAMTSGAEIGQFQPRKEALDAQSATLMLPRDRIGPNDDRHPVISRDQCETIRFALCIVQNKGLADEKLLLGNFNSKIRS